GGDGLWRQDGAAEAPLGPAVRVRGSGGRRAVLLGRALAAAVAGEAPGCVVCMHLHLSPVARVVAARAARLAVFLHGVEAWRPLRRREQLALGRADVLLANSAHTARRFVEANPAFAGRSIA